MRQLLATKRKMIINSNSLNQKQSSIQSYQYFLLVVYFNCVLGNQNNKDLTLNEQIKKTNIGSEKSQSGIECDQKIQQNFPLIQGGQQKQKEQLKQDRDYDDEKQIDDIQEVIIEPLIENKLKQSENLRLQPEQDQKQQEYFGENDSKDCQINENSKISVQVVQQNIEKQDVIQLEGPQNQFIQQKNIQQENYHTKIEDNVKDKVVHKQNNNDEKIEQINKQSDMETQKQQQNKQEKVIENQDTNNQEHKIENFIKNVELFQEQNQQFSKDDKENNDQQIDVNQNPQKEIIQNHIDIIGKSEEQNEIIIPKDNQVNDQIDQNQIQQELLQNHIAYEILNNKFYIHSFKKRQIDDEKLKLFIRDFCSVDKFQEEYNLDGTQMQLFQNQIQYFIPIRGDGNCLFTSIGLQYLYFNLIDDRRFCKFLILIQQSEFKQICKDIRQENNDINDQFEYFVENREEVILKQQFIESIQQLKKVQDQQQLLLAISEQVNNHDGPFYGLLIIFLRNYFRKLLQDFSKIDEIGYIQNLDQIDEIVTWEYMYNETDIALKLFAEQEKILIRCFQKMNVDDKTVQISEYKDDELNQFQYKIGLAFQPGHYNAILLFQ
ncbi:hypothetical protein pb186bvf_005804 [Paramecium bursaria]